MIDAVKKQLANLVAKLNKKYRRVSNQDVLSFNFEDSSDFRDAVIDVFNDFPHAVVKKTYVYGSQQISEDLYGEGANYDEIENEVIRLQPGVFWIVPEGKKSKLGVVEALVFQKIL